IGRSNTISNRGSIKWPTHTFAKWPFLYGPLTEYLKKYADNTEVDPMKLTLSAGFCALLFAGASLAGGQARAASSLADVITSAVADPARPEGDRNRDVARKPVESLQFSGVYPGDAV